MSELSRRTILKASTVISATMLSAGLPCEVAKAQLTAFA
jgi:hypothetical protein